MPVIPALRSDEVHVWRASLAGPSPGPGTDSSLLSREEGDRAARFISADHRDRWAASRAILRRILAAYLGDDPAALRFRAGAQGKPALLRTEGHGDVRFNLSHSGGVALVAVALGREVGVDVERIREDAAGERLAERFFAPAEAAALRTIPARQRAPAFFACWTRKEAYLKARGVGLTFGLDRVIVPVLPEEPASLLAVEGEPGEASRWQLEDLRLAAGFAGAVAVEGRGSRILQLDWPPEGPGGAHPDSSRS